MASSEKKPLSKLKMLKCSYCGIDILDQNLKRHCLNIHNKPRLAAGEATVTSFFSKKRKSTDEEEGSIAPEESTSNEKQCKIEVPINVHEETPASISSLNDNKIDEILERVKNIEISLKNDKSINTNTMEQPSQTIY